MFQFPGFPPPGLWVRPRGDCGSRSRVSPFGHHRIATCTRFPDAFRSVPRPSSAPDAQASPVRLLALVSSYRDRIPATLFSFLMRFDVYSVVKVGQEASAPRPAGWLPAQVGLTRLERVTSPLSEECSNRLSYRPSAATAPRPASPALAPSRAARLAGVKGACCRLTSVDLPVKRAHHSGPLIP